MQVNLYCDGACSPNPGVGGWGCVLVCNNVIRKISGYEEKTTNNRMELMGLIKGMESILAPCDITVTLDSQYVMKAFTEGWLDKWVHNGWKSSTGAVKNQDLWEKLDQLRKVHTLHFNWVKGHNGHHYNEMCDILATDARKKKAGLDMRGNL
jgi:ribonuclease HI